MTNQNGHVSYQEIQIWIVAVLKGGCFDNGNLGKGGREKTKHNMTVYLSLIKSALW